MQIVEFLIWLFFEVICASTGLVIAKTAVLTWRLMRRVVSGGQKPVRPLITADDRGKEAVRMYGVVGLGFWAVLVALLVL